MRRTDWGWQGRTKKLRLRAAHLLKNMTVASDITFVFPTENGTEEQLHAHKIFLAIGSEVFQAMIYGPVADMNNVQISIPNYSKEVFSVLVTFLYTDRAEGLRMENAMDVLQCAQQYGVPELAAFCRSFVCTKLPDNLDMVLPLLVKARELDEPEIEQLATKLLDYEALNILSGPSIVHVEQDLLEEVVQRSQLNLVKASEIELYRAAYRWAQRRADNFVSQDDTQCSELRQVLGPVFNLIRFPLMNYSQLAEGPVKDRMFTFKEMIEVFRYRFQRDNGAEVGTTFPSASRRSKNAQEVVSLAFKAVLTDRRCDNCDCTIDDFVDFTTKIVLDSKACPETSRRFMQMCRENYHCHIYFGDLKFFNHGVDHFGLVLPRPAMSADLLLPLPAHETSLMHDSFGTVALRRRVVDDGNVTYTLDICEEGADSRMEDTTVVFGRLSGSKTVVDMLKLFRRMERIRDDSEAGVMSYLSFEVRFNIELHQPYMYL